MDVSSLLYSTVRTVRTLQRVLVADKTGKFKERERLLTHKLRRYVYGTVPVQYGTTGGLVCAPPRTECSIARNQDKPGCTRIKKGMKVTLFHSLIQLPPILPLQQTSTKSGAFEFVSWTKKTIRLYLAVFSSHPKHHDCVPTAIVWHRPPLSVPWKRGSPSTCPSHSFYPVVAYGFLCTSARSGRKCKLESQYQSSPLSGFDCRVYISVDIPCHFFIQQSK